MPRRDLVARRGEIAEDELLRRELCVDQGFQPRAVLHAVGELIADDGDVLAIFQREFFRRSCVQPQGENESEGEKDAFHKVVKGDGGSRRLPMVQQSSGAVKNLRWSAEPGSNGVQEQVVK